MINWDLVKAACARGKRGTMRPGDQELLEAAYRADPRRYATVKAEADAEVLDEMRNPFGKT